QVPGGEVLDAVREKRVLVAIGVLTIASSTLIFFLWPSFAAVILAEVLQGITGGVLGPAVVAISLGQVALSVGRTARREPALRSRRGRLDYVDDGSRRIF